ncbi:hypothetical protein M3Y95_01086600 [Aphelenchoides besseyi]|nr:hypothetical protein M3Y95_01086600 [Aphelenchoides besseyi]
MFILISTTIVLSISLPSAVVACVKKKEAPPQSAPITNPTVNPAFRFSNIISEVEANNLVVRKEQSETQVEPNFNSNEPSPQPTVTIVGLPPLKSQTQIAEAVTPPVPSMNQDVEKKVDRTKMDIKLKVPKEPKCSNEPNEKKPRTSIKQSKSTRQDQRSKMSTKETNVVNKTRESAENLHKSKHKSETKTADNADMAKNSIQLCSTQKPTEPTEGENEKLQKKSSIKLLEQTCHTAKSKSVRPVDNVKQTSESHEPTTSNDNKDEEPKKSKGSRSETKNKGE